MVGELLIALADTGTARVSLPVCANCGKGLRTLNRVGQDWYCGPCNWPIDRCTICGHDRQVRQRDRNGRPYCRRCQHRAVDDDRDPVLLIIKLVTKLDPSLRPETVTDATTRVHSRTADLRRLAWAIEDRPELLTGDGAHAPAASVLRLIQRLRDAGAQTIIQPECPGCARTVRLVARINARWQCQRCVRTANAQPCSRCANLSGVSHRDQQGQPICANCWNADPINQEDCITCGQRRQVNTRTPDGPLCRRCKPIPSRTCSVCGQFARCKVSKTNGQPWCNRCRRRLSNCARCGQKPTSCRCLLQRELTTLLSNANGEIHPGLRSVYDHLITRDNPSSVLHWLRYSHGAAATVLHEIATGQRALTHQALDELPGDGNLPQLRSLLVDAGALDPRDEHMARLNAWITRTIAAETDPERRSILHQYATWHLLRRLRHRLKGAATTNEQAKGVKHQLMAAKSLLDGLAARNRTLQDAKQGGYEAWLADDTATHRRESGNFVRWANKHNLTRLEAHRSGWTWPLCAIDTEARWQLARRLLTEDTIDLPERVAGLLVLLYGQWPATITRLTTNHVEFRSGRVLLQLAQEPIALPEPLSGLVLDLIRRHQDEERQGIEHQPSWLFPRRRPSQPISALTLTRRLHNLGIHPRQARTTALFQLATELPAAVISRMLGIHIEAASPGNAPATATG